MFANFKNKKFIILTLIILTIPIWLSFVNYIFDFIIEAGRITGSYIRTRENNIICPFER